MSNTHRGDMVGIRGSPPKGGMPVAFPAPGTRDQFGEVLQVLVAELVVPRRVRPEMHGDPATKESWTAAGPETSPAPCAALAGNRLDAPRIRQGIEASPGEEQARGNEMG